MKYIYMTLLFVLCLFSCKENNRKEAEMILKEWTDKEVVFPTKIAFSIQGRSTTDFSIQDSEYKVVAYVDSSGCTSCKLHLSQWKEFIHYTDSTYNNTQFLFFFFPKNARDIYHTLLADKFTYPICIDTLDSFNKLNHFPSDVRFQTFLLDKDNKVVAIGNPVHNPKIKEIYLNIISGGTMVHKEKQVRTEVTANEMALDLGEFGWNERQEATFALKNAGKNLLVVEDIITSCGCTSVEYSKEPVPPGKSLDIKVIYKADHPEHFSKTITVYCNAAASPLQFKVTGEAK